MQAKYYTAREYQKRYQEGIRTGIDGTINGVLACVALNLMDKRGMPPQDAVEVIKSVSYQCDSVNRGEISFADIADTLKAEYDVEIVKR